MNKEEQKVIVYLKNYFYSKFPLIEIPQEMDDIILSFYNDYQSYDNIIDGVIGKAMSRWLLEEAFCYFFNGMIISYNRQNKIDEILQDYL